MLPLLPCKQVKMAACASCKNRFFDRDATILNAKNVQF